MPELPDISAYLSALEPRIVGQPLTQIRIASPFLLRTVQPRIEEAERHTVRSLRRIGKRIAFELDNGLWLVLHLMIAGRLHWRPVGAKLGGRNNLAAFDFPNGSLVLTEAGVPNAEPRSTSSPTKPPSKISTPAVSTSSPPASKPSAPPSPKRTAPSSEPSPTRASSPASATPTPTRSSTPPNSRPSNSRKNSQTTNGNASSTPPAPPSNSGSIASTRKPATVSPKRSPPSATTWPFTVVSDSHVQSAASPSSASATPTTRPTTAPNARPAEKSSQTEACPASSAQTGPAPSTS